MSYLISMVDDHPSFCYTCVKTMLVHANKRSHIANVTATNKLTICNAMTGARNILGQLCKSNFFVICFS